MNSVEPATTRFAFRSLHLCAAGLSGLCLIFGYLAWGGALSPGFIPSTHRDAYEFIWTMWWQRFAIENSLPLYSTIYLYHPDGTSLLLHATSELLTLPAVLFFPAQAPERIFVYLVCFAFGANFLAALSLFLRLSGSLAAAWILSLAFCLHPFFIAHLDGGHLNFLCIFPVLVMVERLIRPASQAKAALRDGLWIAVCFASLPLLNPYYAYFSAIALPMLGVLLAATGSKPPWEAALKITAGLGAGIAASFWKIRAMGELVRSGGYTPNHDPLVHSADLLNLFLPGNAQRISRWIAWDFSSLPLNTSETGLYIGWSAILCLCIVTAMRSAASPGQKARVLVFVLSSFLFFLLSLGPVLQLGGERSVQLHLYDTLAHLLPSFPSVPARFGALAVLLLFAALASGFPLLKSNTRNGVPALLLALMLLEYWPLPPGVVQLQPKSAILEDLAGCGGVRAILDTSTLPQHAMYHQLQHRKPISGGYVARRPKRAERRLRNNYFLRTLSQESPGPIDSARIAASFEALAVDALVIPVEQTSVREHVSKLPWLRSFGKDDSIHVFVRNTDTPLCAAVHGPGPEVGEGVS